MQCHRGRGRHRTGQVWLLIPSARPLHLERKKKRKKREGGNLPCSLLRKRLKNRKVNAEEENEYRGWVERQKEKEKALLGVE